MELYADYREEHPGQGLNIGPTSLQKTSQLQQEHFSTKRRHVADHGKGGRNYRSIIIRQNQKVKHIIKKEQTWIPSEEHQIGSQLEFNFPMKKRCRRGLPSCVTQELGSATLQHGLIIQLSLYSSALHPLLFTTHNIEITFLAKYQVHSFIQLHGNTSGQMHAKLYAQFI